MNNGIDHLSDWQIEELLIAPAETATQSQWLHLEQCPLCGAKQQRLEATLLLYREAALMEANDAALQAAAVNNSLARRKTHSYSAYHLLWGWHARALAVFLLLAALIPAFVAHERGHHQARQIANYVAPQQAGQAKDDLLLQQVDQEITESVPQPMQSLTQPVLDDQSAER